MAVFTIWTALTAFLLCIGLLGGSGVEAKCGTLLRGIKWEGRRPGGYSDSSAANDFSPYKFWKRTSNASLKKVGSKTYLALRMKKGCYGTGGRGCGMYGRLPLNNVKRVKTATLEYTVRFGAGFNWVRGGKLPGLCGGSCTTGCKSPSTKGFSARMMWTDNECGGGPKGCKKGRSGGLHIYNYYANMSRNKGCGEEVTLRKGGKSLMIQPNKDYRIRLVVKLNSPGKKNGYMRSYIDGKQYGYKGGMQLVAKGSQHIDSLMFDNFFGGSASMAAKRDEWLYYKSLYVWEGDCGGSSGSKKGGGAKNVRGYRADSGGGGGGGGGWKPETIDKNSFEGKGKMKTQGLRLDTIFNGGFCAKFTSKNTSGKTCKNFAVEINMDPRTWKLQKYTKSLRVLNKNAKSGWYLFGRAKGLNTKTAPGVARKGQFCAVSHVKAKYTSAQIMRSIRVTTVCDGEGMARRKRSRM